MEEGISFLILNGEETEKGSQVAWIYQVLYEGGCKSMRLVCNLYNDALS